MIYTIYDLATLKKLKHEKMLKNSVRKIQLKIDDPDARSIEKKLNRYFFACGCQEGSIVVSITMGISLMTWAIIGFPRIQPWWMPFAALAIASVLGKITGLIISWRKLRTIFNYLEEHFTETITPNKSL
jgi:hypothetical protein